MLNTVSDRSCWTSGFDIKGLTRQCAVVKNPLSPTEHPGGIGVNCEMFELGLEQFIVRGLHFAVSFDTQQFR